MQGRAPTVFGRTEVSRRMNVVTWNVNSIRQRLARTLALLERHDVDVLGMQETKTIDGLFPLDEMSRAGYRCAQFGQSGRNGVALRAA